MTKADARSLAEGLMDEHGLFSWGFAFNSNVGRAGVCFYPEARKPGRIELSTHFIERNTEAIVRDTILHEIAHALVGADHGHDAVWKAKCREIGCIAQACYGPEVNMPQGRWWAKCPGCRKPYYRHRRPKQLTGWHCKACGPEKGMVLWVVGR